MNDETPRIVNQKEQKEIQRHLKNSGLAVGILFTIVFVIIGIVDYLLL